MDETSPVYENFLNQMKRFRRPIRETTRRISSSKFLNRDEDKNIKEIKDLTGSILETLKRQEKRQCFGRVRTRRDALGNF